MDIWNRFVILCLISFLLVMASCVQPVREREMAPPPGPSPAGAVTEEMLDRRIEYLGNLLQRRDLSEREKEMAKRLIDTYSALKERLPSERENTFVAKGLFNALSHMEMEYFAERKTPDGIRSRVMHEFFLKREEIIDKYLRGDYQGVIDACMELEEAYGKESLTPEIGLYFALSLAKRGLIEEAIKIGEGVLRKLQGKPDAFSLRSAILDWRLALGQDDKASNSYDRLLEELHDRESMVRGAEKRLTEMKQRRKAGPQRAGSISIGITTLAGEFKALEGLFNEVEELLRNNKFQEAKILLLRYRISLEEGPEMDAIDKALDAVDRAELDYGRQRDMRASFREGILNTAARLIEGEQYQEAISRIEYLEKEQGRSPETVRLKEMAVEKLINRERNRAAALFLKAKRIDDPSKREKLLVSALDILRDLMDKYPSSPLNIKLRGHISKVEEELANLKGTR